MTRQSRRRHKAGAPEAPALPETPLAQPGSVAPAPAHVAILGLGPSLEQYVDVVKRIGNRRWFCDEVWGINAVCDVINCDLGFHMDSTRIQEIRAAAKPKSNIAAMLEWLRVHPGPIYTSTPHPEYPGLLPYPLEDVINDIGVCYFNGTGAYAIAYAIFRGVKRISVFGCDYSFENSHHAEKGRANFEFMLGIAKQRGIVIGLPDRTSLMDVIEAPETRLYGYDEVVVEIAGNGDTPATLTMKPRASLPSAEEIEEKYDHSKKTVNAALLPR